MMEPSKRLTSIIPYQEIIGNYSDGILEELYKKLYHTKK